MTESLIGKTIGKYQIVELLGRGGMAEVYKAYQPALDRYVAIKIMHSFLAEDEDFLGRFQREAKAVGRLRHPNIVQVHDFDVADGVYYMVMEFIDGYTLKAKLQDLAATDERMPLEEAIRVTRGVAAALAYAHKRDMVHRDVKAANVMVNQDGQVILTDFGIAKILSGPQFTASGAMIGTPAYMSPEQGLGEPGDARSDIYSLGIMLFQMTTGQLPYDADTPLAVVLKHVNNPLPIPSQLNSAIPPGVERVIFKTLAKNPDDRYQTADEFIEHLDRIKAGLAVPESAQPTLLSMDQAAAPTIVAPSASVAQVAAAPPAKTGRSKWIWAGIGIGAIILLIIAAGAAWGLSGILASATSTATPTEDQTIVVPTAKTEPATPVPSSPSRPSDTPPPEATAMDPVDAASTALARYNATLTAQAATLTAQAPTVTPLPTFTFTPSPTPPLACDHAYEIVAYFTYNNPNNYNQSRNQTLARTDSRFALTVRLDNQGSCPWPAGTQLVFLQGNALGAGETMATTAETEIESIAEFGATMTSGDETGLMVSAWELQLPDGTPIGDPLELRISIYQPATPSPTLPPQPTATPTSETTGPIDFTFTIDSCEYAGDQWRCRIGLHPSGGIGQPYTFWVWDGPQPTEYRGGVQYHWVQSRRCFAWVHEIKLQDDGGNSTIKNIFIDPNDYFPGGCTEP